MCNLERNLNLTKVEMFERDEPRCNLFVINCKDDGGLDREEARRRAMARVEVNLIYPFFPAPPLQICWIKFLNPIHSFGNLKTDNGKGYRLL